MSRFALNPDLSSRELRDLTVRGGFLTMGATAVRQVIMLAATVVLARLLTPDDFGVVAMATAIVTILENLKEIGLSAATIQRPSLAESQVTGLFWVNALVTAVLVAVLALTAPQFARFYQRTELTGIVWALATGFLGAGLCVQQWALLRRNLRFGTLAAIETCGTVAGVAGAVAAACAGLGYWALLAVILIPRYVNVAGAWLVCPWRPGWPPRFQGLLELLAFGAKMTGFNVLDAIAKSIDTVLIGRFCGASALGLYTRALQIRAVPVALVHGPLSSVATASLSRLQTEPERCRAAFVRFTYLAGALLTPFWLCTTLAPEALLRVVFGSQWTAAADLARILGLLLVLQPATGMLVSLGIALNRMTVLLLWGSLSAVLLAAGFVAGIGFGPAGVATAYVAATAAALFAAFRYALAAGLLRAGDLLHGVLPPIAMGTVACCAAWAGSLAWAHGAPSWITRNRSLSALGLALLLYAAMAFLDLRRRRFLGLEPASLFSQWRTGPSERPGPPPSPPQTGP